MPKKEGGGKETKEKITDEKMARRESTSAKDKKEAVEKSIRKEPTTSKDLRGKDRELSENEETVTLELNAKVLCKHRDNLYYEAKIIGVEESAEKGKIFTVHYQGWNSRHDEKIPEVDAAKRCLPCTDENLEAARAEMLEARLMDKKKKGKKITGLVEEKKNGTNSRGSTPSEKVPSRPASHTSAEKGATPSSGVGRKRKLAAMEPEIPIDDIGVPKAEIKIEIPAALKDILVDDQDMVQRQMYLVSLPARYTVEDIIKQYAEYTGVALNDDRELTFEHSDAQTKMSKDTLIESSHGVQDFFNTTLGSQLLYKFERPQYAELFEAKNEELNKGAAKTENGGETSSGEPPVKKKWKPSDTYGFIHLLRLFVKFGSMLGMTKWSDRAVKNIVEHVHDFLVFLDKNRHNYFDIQKDYIVASPEYQKRVWNV